MTKQPSPRYDALRAMREANFEKNKPVTAPKKRKVKPAKRKAAE